MRSSSVLDRKPVSQLSIVGLAERSRSESKVVGHSSGLVMKDTRRTITQNHENGRSLGPS